MLLGNSSISWKSKKQTIVSKSSKLTWLVRLLNELGVTNLTPIKLSCDNQSAIHLGITLIQDERTKHIKLDIHFTRDKVLEGLLELAYISIGKHITDLLTKTLPSPQLTKFDDQAKDV